MLTTEEAAAILGLSPDTLKQWRRLDDGPPYYTFGRAIRYREDLLIEWREICKHTPDLWLGGRQVDEGRAPAEDPGVIFHDEDELRETEAEVPA